MQPQLTDTDRIALERLGRGRRTPARLVLRAKIVLLAADGLEWALERRGHKPFVVSCDMALTPRCNSGVFPELSVWTCRTCHFYARKTRELAGVPTLWITVRILSPRARSSGAKLLPSFYGSHRWISDGGPLRRLSTPAIVDMEEVKELSGGRAPDAHRCFEVVLLDDRAGMTAGQRRGER